MASSLGLPLAASAQQAPSSQTAQASAESDTGGLGEIVVTARKRSEKLQDIPVTVTALGEQQIEQQGITDLSDVAKYTPGLTYDEGISRLDTRPAIRGLYVQRGRPSVAILQDGFDLTSESIVSAGGGSLLNQNLLDVERIEVVEGPQSVLYGRSAFGGAINYVTRRPTEDFTGELNAEIGNYGTYKVFGSVSGPIVADKLLFRVSAEGDGNDGYYTNNFTGSKDLDATGDKGLSADLEAHPIDDLTIRLRAEASSQDGTPRAAVNVKSNTLLPSNCTNVALGCSASAKFYQVVGNVTASPDQVAYSGNYPGARSTTYRGTATVDYNLGWADFTSMSGYLQDRTKLTQDTDYEAYPSPPAFFAYENELQDLFEDTTQISQELRLASPADSPVKWLGGFLFFYEDARVHDSTQYTVDHPNPFNPLARTQLTSVEALLSPTQLDRRTYHESLFGSVGYEVVENFNVTAELRVATESLSVSKPFQSRTSIITYTGGITPGPGGAPQGITYVEGSLTSYYVNPRISLDYKLTPEALVYFTWSKGTKPGGFSLLNISNSNLASQKYAAEKLYTYELGAKTDWMEHKLRINGDIYFNDYHDQQVSLADTAVSPPVTTVGNAGSVYGIGEEVAITYRPIPPLTFDIAYNHIDEYYESYVSSVANDLQSLPGGNFAGKRIPSVPEHTLSATARYEMPITEMLAGFIQTSATYESARYGNAYNTWTFGNDIRQDVQLGVEADTWTALFYVNNMWDDRTPSSGIGYFDLHQDFRNTALVYLPDPMTFGVRASVKF